jgi:hypothetical protein
MGSGVPGQMGRKVELRVETPLPLHPPLAPGGEAPICPMTPPPPERVIILKDAAPARETNANGNEESNAVSGAP